VSGGAPTTVTRKTFNVGSYTKARFVIHVKERDGRQLAIAIGSALVKAFPIFLPAEQWCRVAFNVPISSSVNVSLAASEWWPATVCIDDIWLIAK
jgi:hypothetical protein